MCTHHNNRIPYTVNISVSRSWWWAKYWPKHVELILCINKSLLHLVGSSVLLNLIYIVLYQCFLDGIILRKRAKCIVGFFSNDDFSWPPLHDVTPQETSVCVHRITTVISCCYVHMKQVLFSVTDMRDRFLWCFRMLCPYKAVSIEITLGPLGFTG